MTAFDFDLGEALQVLERTPAVLRSLMEGESAPWLNYQEDSEAWSPRTVVIHYIQNEQVNWIPRIRVIRSGEGERAFAPFEQLPRDAVRDGTSTDELLDEFSGLRQDNLSELRGMKLTPEDLDREGLHPDLGPVTLRQVLSAWVVHDLNHLHQIAKTQAKRYTVDVGPYRRFLAVLDI